MPCSHQKLPVLEKGTLRYVQYAPVSTCDFDPDLLFFVADLPQAELTRCMEHWQEMAREVGSHVDLR